MGGVGERGVTALIKVACRYQDHAASCLCFSESISCLWQIYNKVTAARSYQELSAECTVWFGQRSTFVECRTELAESETSSQGGGQNERVLCCGADMYITEYQALCGRV